MPAEQPRLTQSEPPGREFFDRKRKALARIPIKPTLIVLNDKGATESVADERSRLLEASVNHQFFRESEADWERLHIHAKGVSPKTIGKVKDALDQSIGFAFDEGKKREFRVGQGLGQPVYLRGSFTQKQIRQLAKSLEWDYGVTPEVVNLEKETKMWDRAEEIVNASTIPQITDGQKRRFIAEVTSQETSKRQLHVVLEHAHDLFMRGGHQQPRSGEPDEHFKTPIASTTVMLKSYLQDIFAVRNPSELEDEELEPGEQSPYNIYYALERGTNRDTRDFPVMRSHQSKKFRVVGLDGGKVGNQVDSGQLHSITPFYNLQPHHPAIDEALGRTPRTPDKKARTEFFIPLGNLGDAERSNLERHLKVPPGHLGAIHGLTRNKMPLIAFYSLLDLVNTREINDAIVSSWKDEHLEKRTYMGLFRQLMNLCNYDEETANHSLRVAELTGMLAHAYNHEVDEQDKAEESRKAGEKQKPEGQPSLEKLDSEDVGFLKAGAFAHDIGLHLIPRREVEQVKYAALLHDLGKGDVLPEIISKTGKLDPDELIQLRMHPVFGSEILKREGLSPRFELIALNHHQQWDGKHGYPLATFEGVEPLQITGASEAEVRRKVQEHLERHAATHIIPIDEKKDVRLKWNEGRTSADLLLRRPLKGTEIPLEARLAAVADVFEALAAERPYKKALPLDKAVEKIREGSGTHFDPFIVKAFLNLPQEELEKVMSMRFTWKPKPSLIGVKKPLTPAPWRNKTVWVSQAPT